MPTASVVKAYDDLFNISPWEEDALSKASSSNVKEHVERAKGMGKERGEEQEAKESPMDDVHAKSPSPKANEQAR